MRLILLSPLFFPSVKKSSCPHRYAFSKPLLIRVCFAHFHPCDSLLSLLLRLAKPLFLHRSGLPRKQLLSPPSFRSPFGQPVIAFPLSFPYPGSQIVSDLRLSLYFRAPHSFRPFSEVRLAPPLMPPGPEGLHFFGFWFFSQKSIDRARCRKNDLSAPPLTP